MAKKQLTQADKLALAEYAAPLSLWAFCCYWDYDFFAVRRPYLKQVADAYQLAYECWVAGTPTRTAVSLPPRGGKSYLTTLACAWILGRSLWVSVMRCTGTAQLFAKFSRDCRTIVSDPHFRRIFPSARLNPSNRGVMQWSLKTSKQTAYFGNGVGGSIIGFGANFGILDDLYPDMLKALSSTYTERVNMWLDSAFTSRLEKGAPVIYCGTRWTETDMIGRAMEEGLDAYLRIPALDENGETFCADVKTTAEYQAIRKSMRIDDTHDGYTWLAEYMQTPQRIDGYLYPADALTYYDEYPQDVTLLESCCFVDPSDTGEDGFTAALVDIVSEGGEVTVYLRDVFNSSGEGVEAGSARVADRCNLHRTQTCLVEVNGVGRAAYILIRNAVKDTSVRAYMERTPKEVRILSTFEHVRRAFRFPRPRVDNAMYYRFFDQLRGTPAKKLAEYRHRLDPADTLAQASNYVKQRYGYAAYRYNTMGWLNKFLFRSDAHRAVTETDAAGNFWIFPDGGLPADVFGGGWRGHVGAALHVPEVFFPVDAIAERASSLPFRLMRDGLPVEEGGEPMGFRRLFERPNLQQDFGQLVYDLLFYRLATGTTWLWSDRVAASPLGTSAIRVLDPEAVTPLYRSGMPAGWMRAGTYDEIVAGFCLPDGSRLEVSDVLISTERPDPSRGGVYGLSVLDTADVSVAILRSVYRARYNVYNANGAAGILCKEGEKGGFGASVDPRERKAVADELSERYNIVGFSQSIKAISTVPLKFIDTLAKIKDLEPFKESDRDALAIAALYQVPKHLVPNEIGVTFENAKESEVAFWDNVVLPAAELAGSLIGRAMSLPEGYTLAPDKTDVSVLQEDRLGSLQADKQEIENLQTLSTAFPELAPRAGALAEAMITRYEQSKHD